MNISS